MDDAEEQRVTLVPGSRAFMRMSRAEHAHCTPELTTSGASKLVCCVIGIYLGVQVLQMKRPCIIMNVYLIIR